MSAEKQIVDYWLNKSGFFTIKDINVRNKDIGILAINFDDAKPRVKHFAISCSVTSSALETKNIKKSVNDYVLDHFDNPIITKKINILSSEYLGIDQKIEKVLILGVLPDGKRKEIKGLFKSKKVDVLEFKNILREVMQHLGTHYYRDPVVRSLQLVKYLLISQPVQLAQLMKGEKTLLKQHKMDRFISSLLKGDSTIRALGKTDEDELISILKHPMLKKPEILAKLIVENVLGKNSKKKFLEEFLKQDKVKKMFTGPVVADNIEDALTKKQKQLKYFFKKAM